jgi:flagellar protein FliS
MWRDSYLDNQVMAADPIELVRMLYRGAVDAVRDARRRLAVGQIQERSNAINRILAIVDELNASLDHTNGGEISRNLAELYAYIIQLLMRANIRQEDAPLAEAESLLTTLSQGWEQATLPRDESQMVREAAPAYQLFETGLSEQGHNWSA